jgi:predicted transcriptional regulator
MTTTEIQLPKVVQTRISRLAHASGRSPAAMLRFVLRDGFDAVELSIKENAQADAEFAAGATVGHADVMRDALNAVRQARHEALAAA